LSAGTSTSRKMRAWQQDSSKGMSRRDD
jgi:hypothetical protein